MEKDIHPGPPGPSGEGAVLNLPTGKDRRGSMDVKRRLEYAGTSTAGGFHLFKELESVGSPEEDCSLLV